MEKNPVTIPSEVLEAFRDGFDDEHYLVDAIKKYLRTQEQKAILDAKDISIEDVINGREGEALDSDFLASMYDDWNAKLGFHGFGF